MRISKGIYIFGLLFINLLINDSGLQCNLKMKMIITFLLSYIIRYLISLYNLHEDDVPGERNHAIQKNTCLTSFVHRSCSLFSSSSCSSLTLRVWNPFPRLFNVRWAKSSNDLWLDFSRRKDAQPMIFTLDFKQSMVLLLIHSKVCTSRSRNSSVDKKSLLTNYAQDGPRSTI
jgi:hypothetical protein